MTQGPEWELEFFEDDAGNQPCRRWMERDLSENQRLALIAGLERILAFEGMEVCRTEHGKQLGKGLFEYRLRHTAEEIAQMFPGRSSQLGHAATAGEKILLRVFCHAHGQKVILLLGGYDKGAHPSSKRQRKEIKVAGKHLKEFKRQEQARKRNARAVRGPKGPRVSAAKARLGLDWAVALTVEEESAENLTFMGYDP